MNRAKRDQAVRVFMSKDKARVMLMSMKCGGTGHPLEDEFMMLRISHRCWTELDTRQQRHLARPWMVTGR